MRVRGTYGVGAVVIAVLSVAGCAGSSSSASAAADASIASETPAPPLTTAASPTLPAGGPAPAALRHRWVDVANDQVHLTLKKRTYEVRIMSYPGVVVDTTSFRGASLWATLASGGSCAGVGHYRWSIVGSRLRFHKISDPCSSRTDIFSRVYRR